MLLYGRVLKENASILSIHNFTKNGVPTSGIFAQLQTAVNIIKKD